MVKLAIVVAEFNYDVTQLMLQKALDHARFLGAEVTYVVKAPGVFDVPALLADVVRKDDVDAVAVLGAVIQGATRHDELVANQAAPQDTRHIGRQRQAGGARRDRARGQQDAGPREGRGICEEGCRGRRQDGQEEAGVERG
jgi:6,7-dimethyl-8-ribityllumazine synthase